MRSASKRITSVNIDINKTTMSKDKKEPIRKEGKKRGVTTQKMVTFRCDLDNIEWLETKVNKGRYINDLIAKDRGA